MIFGMSVATFTLLHVVISLIGIFTGLVVLAEMLTGKPLGRMNEIFLITTIATSVTGFFFHSVKFGPPHIVGVLSLVVLAVALYALYGQNLLGRWRAIYVMTAVFVLYLNVFVGVVQTFQKISFFRTLAPTQSEPPFVVVQAFVLLGFITFGYWALKRFRPI